MHIDTYIYFGGHAWQSSGFTPAWLCAQGWGSYTRLGIEFGLAMRRASILYAL